MINKNYSTKSGKSQRHSSPPETKDPINRLRTLEIYTLSETKI